MLNVRMLWRICLEPHVNAECENAVENLLRASCECCGEFP